jgi:Plasmid pRiA4b ORF-3-like protein
MKKWGVGGVGGAGLPSAAVPTTPPALSAYQLRVALRRVSPLVWRRLLVREDTVLAELHRVLQVALGWHDEHLHRFLVHGQEYGGAGMSGRGARVRLSDLRLHPGEHFLYEYDLSDGWVHEVRLERFLPLDPRRPLPICLAGRRATPPEGCGGSWAYLAMLDELTHHPPPEAWATVTDAVGRLLGETDRSRRVREVIGDLDGLREAVERVRPWMSFHPDRFERRTVNEQLRNLEEGGER